MIHSGVSVKAIDFELSERIIEKIDYLTIEEDTFNVLGDLENSRVSVEGNGQFDISSNTLIGNYKGELGSYQMKVNLGSFIEAINGITARFRVSGWERIRYFAIGYTEEDSKKFHHVKITNLNQDHWVDVSLGLNDLVNLIQNGWDTKRTDRVGDIRLYVSGLPSGNGARISFAHGSIWRESDTIKGKLLDPRPNETLYAELLEYFQKCNPRAVDQVQNFLELGECPMSGKVALPWKPSEKLPEGMGESGTYRYLWHALQPVILMLIYAYLERDESILFSARDLTSQWLSDSFFSEDPDKKYSWYDHGTAERLMAFLMVQQIGMHRSFDARFMSRLQVAIIKHAQLLESEVFYAYHQSSRYHNHAWFQDMALISAGVALPELPCSARWIARGVSRLEDQLAELIVRDGGYAIFVENSIGYHQGIQRLVEFASALIKMAHRQSVILEMPKQLERWSAFLKYPNGFPPAQGDTFKAHTGFNRGALDFETGITVLENAGYAVVKGMHESIPFMLCMFSTSLNRTHKHEDNLAVSLFFDGVEWLTDPSFYSHNYDEKIPAYLRSAEAHNCVWIPELTYSIDPNRSSIDGAVEGSSFSFHGRHRSYGDISVTRKVNGNTENFGLQVADKVVAPFKHSRERIKPKLVLHFGEKVSAESVPGGIELSHPATERRVFISLPKLPFSLVFGDQGKDISVIGLGFMEFVDSWSALVEIPLNKELSWSVHLR